MKKLIFLALIFLHNFVPTFERRLPNGVSMFAFERVVCTVPPGSKVKAAICKVKYIDRYRLKVDVGINISEPINDIWINGVMYYKYNTYQRIAIDIWEDICGYLSGRSISYILYWSFGVVRNYSNIEGSCPLMGYKYLKIDKVPISKFKFPSLMPAGRYRADLTYTEGKGGKLVAKTQLFGSLSDHRLEIV